MLTAFIFEGVNRLVQVLFKFVPLRTGVDELTTGSFTAMLGFGAALGITLAIVRKIRTIAWVLVGTSLLVQADARRAWVTPAGVTVALLTLGRGRLRRGRCARQPLESDQLPAGSLPQEVRLDRLLPARMIRGDWR